MRKLLKTKASRKKKTFFAYNLRLNLRQAQKMHKMANDSLCWTVNRKHFSLLEELRDALSVVPKPGTRRR